MDTCEVPAVARWVTNNISVDSVAGVIESLAALADIISNTCCVGGPGCFGQYCFQELLGRSVQLAWV